MANQILVKRSSVANKVPLTTDIALGELAINTYDGKLYLQKNNGTASIVEVGAASAPVQSVAGRTGAVVLAVADVTGAAPLASPAFTGTPTVPTATLGTSTTQAASTNFVTSSIAGLFKADGTVAMTGAISATVGTVAAPSITLGDLQSGLFRSGSNNVSIGIGGASKLSISGSQMVSSVNTFFTIGANFSYSSAASPAINWNSDSTTGIWGVAGAVSIATSGINRLTVNSTGVILSADPSTAMGAATKQYVDSVAAGAGNIKADGSVAMTGPLKFVDGTAAAPGLVLGSTAGYGIFKNGTAALSIAIAGAAVMNFSTGAAGCAGTIYGNTVQAANNGTAAAPTINFTNDATTGMYLTSNGVLSFATAGVNRVSINSAGAAFTVPVTAPSATMTGTLTAQTVNTGVNAAVAAAGTTQATGTALATSINVVTTGTGGVILPTAIAGALITVINTTGAAINVYPATGAQIDILGANVAFSLGTIAKLEFVAVSATQWYALTAVYA